MDFSGIVSQVHPSGYETRKSTSGLRQKKDRRDCSVPREISLDSKRLVSVSYVETRHSDFQGFSRVRSPFVSFVHEIRNTGAVLMHTVVYYSYSYTCIYNNNLRATHARTLLPAALASVSFGFILVRVVRVRVRVYQYTIRISRSDKYGICHFYL